MNNTPAGAGPVDVSVRPCAWATRYSPQGLLHTLRDTETDANDDAAIVGGSAHVVALYDQSALDAAVAAERERWAPLAAELKHMAKRVEMPDGDYCSVGVAMWAEDWLRKLNA